MQPNHFRAYAGANPALYGDVVDGVATFDSDEEITHVAFYDGDGEGQAVCASADFDRAGEFELHFVEATESDEAKIVEA